jgi:hypothetical protein
MDIARQEASQGLTTPRKYVEKDTLASTNSSVNVELKPRPTSDFASGSVTKTL